jgi:hypothetical protein
MGEFGEVLNEKMRKKSIKMFRDFTEREEKKKLGGGEDRDPNSFVELNMFVKHRSTEFSMENEEILETLSARK